MGEYLFQSERAPARKYRERLGAKTRQHIRVQQGDSSVVSHAQS
jgi:hypothetical protein